MGYIRKRSNGWSYTVSLGLNLKTNEYKQKSKGGFKTKAECKAAMVEIENKINKNEYFEESKITLESYLNEWLDNIRYNIAESTYVFYKDIVDRILIKNLGKIQIEKLKALQIQSFLTNMINKNVLSTTTVRHYYNVLNIALNQAVKWQIIQMNPCNLVEAPKKQKAKIAVLKPNEVDKLLLYTKKSEYKVMYIPLVLALTCGMRRGEILGLQWEDVDLEKGITKIKHNLVKVGTSCKLTTPKTDSSIRTIALLPTTIKVLKEYKENKKIIKINKDYDYVCCWENGEPIKPDYPSHTLKVLLERCNLPHIRFHDLRHTHATMLLMQNVNVKVVSERLGHSKIDMTLDTYSHVLPQMQQEAVDKLEDLLFKKAK